MTQRDGWRIEPARVQKVLTDAQEAGESLGESLSGPKFEGPIADAIEGAAGSPPVADALVAFFENRQRTIRGMTDRVNAGVTGAATATGWYVKGDEKMAADQQANISKAASSGDLSGFSVPE